MPLLSSQTSRSELSRSFHAELPGIVVEQALAKSWQGLFALLASRGTQQAQGGQHCLRLIIRLQTFLRARIRLSNKHLRLLPRLCQQVLTTTDADLREQLLVCCFRFYQQQCGGPGRVQQLLVSRARAELGKLQHLQVVTDEACARQTRALRALGIWCGPVTRPAEQELLVAGLQLYQQHDQGAQKLMQGLLEQLGSAIVSTSWQPQDLHDPGLLKLCRQAQALACFGPRATSESAYALLLLFEQQLVALHLDQCHPAALVERLLAALMVIQYQVSPGAGSGAQRTAGRMARTAQWFQESLVAERQGRAIAAAGFAGHLQQTRHTLQRTLIPADTAVPCDISRQMLEQAYALQVACLQLQAGSLTLVYRGLYQLLCQYWYQQPALPGAIATQLHDLLAQADADPGEWAAAATGSAQASLAPALKTQILLRKLMQCWPRQSIPVEQGITLATSTGAAQGQVALDAMPRVLARGLDALVKVQASQFADRSSFRQHQSALQAALMLLEQGAAAIRVKGVEKVCSMLLDCYLGLQSNAGSAFPGGLLWRVHVHLRALLDSAACWWETQPDQPLVQELSAYLQASQVLLPATALAEPQAMDWLTLRQHLQGYVLALAQVLDIQVRLHISGQGEPCSETALLVLQQAMLPLLRFQLLDFSLGLDARRARRQPVAGNIWLQLHQDEGGIRVVLSDDSGRPGPDVLQWQQLQHRMSRAGLLETSCSSATLGRQFEGRLPV